MLSRVADSLYWMSRYLERAEHTARVITVSLNLSLDISDASVDEGWVRAASNLGMPPVNAGADATALAKSLVFSAASRSSIVACIMTARENARQVREQISSEMWGHLNRLFHEVRRASVDDSIGTEPLEFLDTVIAGIHLFQGITDSTMAHGEGWQFIQSGRFAERALGLSTLLRAHFNEFPSSDDGVVDPRDHLHWVALLKSCTAFEAYCKVYTAHLRSDKIAEFLLLNPEFPHSMRFSVDMLHHGLESLPETRWTKKSNRLTRLSGRLKAALSFSQIDEVIAGGMNQYLDNITLQCGQIHAALYQVYIHYPIESAVEA
jgi:uncharacterized alpha-E superfamily protein